MHVSCGKIFLILCGLSIRPNFIWPLNWWLDNNKVIKFIDDSKFKDSRNIKFGLISTPIAALREGHLIGN